MNESTMLADEKQLSAVSLPKCNRNVASTSICSNAIKVDLRKQIGIADLKDATDAQRKQYDAELAKYKFTVRLLWAGVAIDKLVGIASQPQSLIVAVQAYLRDKGDAFLTKLANGDGHKEGAMIEAKDHIITVGVLVFEKREKKSNALTPEEKLARFKASMSDSEWAALIAPYTTK